MKTAILVDGGFYRKRAASLWGIKSAEERAKELQSYCKAHLKAQESELYRVFYYDCAPSEGQAYHPLIKKNINLKKTDTYIWTQTFLEELRKARKFAVRLGVLSEVTSGYALRKDITKKLFAGSIKLSEYFEEIDGYAKKVAQSVKERAKKASQYIIGQEIEKIAGEML